MKTSKIQILILFTILTFRVNGQESIAVSGTKFTYPLVKRWIAEYSKVNPKVNIVLDEKGSNAKQADLSVIAHQPEKEELSGKQQVLYVSKYALLPVTVTSNAYLGKIKKRGLDKKDLGNLFFEKPGDFAEEKEQEGAKEPVTIYAGVNQSSSSIAFSNYFGFQPSALKGKKILGDDIYLLSAIKKDSAGVTFNNLGYIYDLQSRKLKTDLAVLPLDIERENRSLLIENLDNAINLLETVRFETIPVEKVGLVVNNDSNNEDILRFVKWVISDGQKYNHEYGFLNLDKELQANQTEKLSGKLLVSASK